jgi:hypothetical protein
MGATAIGVDFDGTICDTTKLKQEYVLEKKGIRIKPWETNRTSLTEEMKVLTEGEYDTMIGYVCAKERTLSAESVAGAKKSLQRLSKERNIYIITERRGPLLSAAVDWMSQNGMDHMVSGYFSSEGRGSKLSICRRMNMSHLIEDDPGHFRENNDNVVGILLKHGSEGETTHPTLKHARDWEEAVSHIL